MNSKKHQTSKAATKNLSWLFDDFTLSYHSGLQRSGDRLEIEPKTLELLVYLVANRKRIIDRTELLDQVWKDEVVEESTISQTIYKLRKILGDGAKQPLYIETVHRRGYQFIAKLDRIPKITTSNHSTHRWIWVFVFVFVLLSSIFFWNKYSTEIQTPPRLALIPINSQSEDPQIELLAQMFDDLLYSRLAAQKELIVRSRSTADASTLGIVDVLDYAKNLQVGWLLQGKFETRIEPKRLWLRMELLRINNGDVQSFPLSRIDLPIPKENTDYQQLIDVKNRIAQMVGEHIGTTISAASQTNSDPLNLEVLRLVSLATRELSELQCSASSSIQYLTDAVKIDPEYTDAWTVLGYAYFNELWACGGNVSYLLKAHEMAKKALLLEPENPFAIHLEAQLLASLGQADKALIKLHAILKKNNTNAILHFYTSVLLNYAGQLDLSEQHLNQALSLDPFVLNSDSSDPPLVLLYQKRWREFLNAWPATDSSYHRFYRGYALWRNGDIEAARTIMQPLNEKDWKKDPFATYAQALLAIFEDDNKSASEKVIYMYTRRHDNGIKDGEMTFKEAWLMALAQQPDIAMDYLETSLTEGFSCLQCIHNSPFNEILTDQKRFRRILQDVQFIQEQKASLIN